MPKRGENTKLLDENEDDSIAKTEKSPNDQTKCLVEGLNIYSFDHGYFFINFFIFRQLRSQITNHGIVEK